MKLLKYVTTYNKTITCADCGKEYEINFTVSKSVRYEVRRMAAEDVISLTPKQCDKCRKEKLYAKS